MINYNALMEESKIDHIQKIVVGAIIYHNNKILILKRNADDFMGGIYELPSGNLEKDESIDCGLKREILEETNLHIKSIDAYLGSFDYLSSSKKSKAV